MSNRFQIGDVYLIKFDGDEHEQTGVRPGLVFQNNVGNMFSPNIIVLPLTSSVKKLNDNIPTHVRLRACDTGLKRDSVVLCENPTVISKSKCGAFLTRIPDKYMTEVAVGNLIATSAISFISPSMFQEVWNKCVSLNLVR